ncbi:MAG: insulinase family protein [Vampirovibrionia bacterium]
MSFTNTTLKSPSLNPFKALGGEIEYTIHDLTHRVKSLGRSALEKLRSLKPVSREFTQKLASPDGIAQEYIYTNGLRVFNVHDKKIKRTSVQLTIQLPQTHEKIAGTNHFLEHMLVTNPLNSLKKDIMTWASENGVACKKAATSNQKMFFSFSLAPDKLKMVLKFLANLYQEKPLEYDPKILEGERDVIQKERQGDENNPAWALGLKIAEFFKGKGHYSSKNILGTKKDISEISPEHLEEARKCFNIAESTLVITSPSSYLADASIHECFQGIKPKESKNERTPVNYSQLGSKAKQVFKHHDLSDSLSQVFYPNPEKLLKSHLSTLDKQRLTAALLFTMFIGDDSRLRQEFNKQKINVGSVGINFDNEDRGALNLSINRTDKKYFSKVLPIIHQQLKKIAAEGLNLEELNLVKKMVENGQQITKEDPASEYQVAIQAAISQEHEHWLDFTPDKEMKDFWNKITKDQESLNAFNDELKEFLDIYFLSAKAKTLETHCDNNSNVGNFSSENMQVGETQNHYERPAVEPSQKPDFIRLPAGLASMKKLDKRSYLVKDQEANLVRVYVLNKNGMGRLSDTVLNSNNPDLISKETYKQEILESLAESLFTETLGAEASLSPENIDKVTKNLGIRFDLVRDAKILGFWMSGVKAGAVEMLGLVKQIFASPALLSDKPEVKSRVQKEFDHAVERYIKNLLERKQDRDFLLNREFYNAIFASDPERQSLDIDSQIQILKSINLDDVRKFFEKNYIFDENLKILLNDVAVDSGLNSNAVTDALMQLNPGKVKAQEPYEYKVLEIPSSQKILMSSNLDKSSASINIGNLTEDLSGLSKEDRMLLGLSIGVLCEDPMTSRLGARLREKGIYYWRSNFQLPSENLGKVTVPQKAFSINCHCNPSQVDEIKQVINTTIEEYLANGPKPEELAQAQHGLAESFADALKNIEARYAFLRETFKINKPPSAEIKALNRSYRHMQPRAKELLKMVIKPDNFIEVVDIPKSACQVPEWNQNYSGRFKNT